MAFSRFQSATSGSDSFFSPYKHQSSLTGDKVRLPQPYASPLPFPGFTPAEEPSLPYVPWAAQEDSYELGECATNRALADGNECGSEADLYGLVSNILEESDQTDADFAEETLSSLKSVWSPKSAREDGQQFFLSESKMQSNSAFPVYYDSFNRCQRHFPNKEALQRTEFHQGFNGFDVKDQWPFPPGNGDTDVYSLQRQDVERMFSQEGTTARNPFLSKSVPETEYGAAGKIDGFCGGSTLPDHMDGTSSFYIPSRLNDHFFSAHSSHSTHGRTKPHRSRPFPMLEGSTLASDVQAFLAGERDSFCKEAQNKQMGQRDFYEQASDQQSYSYSRIPALDIQVPQFNNELAVDFGELRAPGSKVKTRSPTSDYYAKGFSGSHNSEHFQPPPRGFSSSFSTPAPFLGKPKDNYAVSNPYASHHSQLSQYLNQVKQSNGNSGVSGLSKMLSQSGSEFVPQHSHQVQRVVSCLTDYAQGDGPNIPNRAPQCHAGLNLDGLKKAGDSGEFERDKSIVHASFISEAQSPQRFDGKIKPQSGAQRGGDKKQCFPPDAYLDFLGRAYGSQRHTGGSFSVNNSGKKLPSALFPHACSVGDPRRNPYQMQLNFGGFPSRSTFPYGNSIMFMDLCNLLPDSEFPSFNPYLQDTSGDGPFLGIASTLRSPRLARSRCAPTSQLHHQLEECYEQWRVLEKERKKTEAFLAECYPGKRVSVVSSSSVLLKVPPNPSRVDRLIVDQLREQARVVSLLGKMENLRSFPLHANIFSALDRHLEAIYITQTRRNEEFVNSSNRQRQEAPYFGEDRDVLLLAAALRDMCGSTRRSRTALWCALQIAFPQTAPSKQKEQGDPQGFPKEHALF